MKKNKIFKVILIIVIIMLIYGGEKVEVAEIEDKEISAGIGLDIIKQGKDTYVYAISDNVYFFTEDLDLLSGVYTGKAASPGRTRDDRATKLAKQFFLGLEKIFLLDEGMARIGIRPAIDILFSNPSINDNAFYIVTKGPTVNYLKHSIEGFSSPSEYIEGMIKHMQDYNFFAQDYKVKNIFLNLDAEGRNIAIPYMEFYKDVFKISGIAIFDKDKLVRVLDMNETKIMNLLRNDNAKGMLTIQKNDKEYINYYAKTKKRVNCTKKGDKYHFIIDLKLSGDVVTNTLYKDMDKKADVVKEFEKDMQKKVEAMCNEFLEKMKNTYNIDCLELGRLAAAKYGRDTGVDWNKVISNSEIEVKVKVKVDKVGRGQY